MKKVPSSHHPIPLELCLTTFSSTRRVGGWSIGVMIPLVAEPNFQKPSCVNFQYQFCWGSLTRRTILPFLFKFQTGSMWASRTPPWAPGRVSNWHSCMVRCATSCGLGQLGCWRLTESPPQILRFPATHADAPLIRPPFGLGLLWVVGLGGVDFFRHGFLFHFSKHGLGFDFRYLSGIRWPICSPKLENRDSFFLAKIEIERKMGQKISHSKSFRLTWRYTYICGLQIVSL